MPARLFFIFHFSFFIIKVHSLGPLQRGTTAPHHTFVYYWIDLEYLKIACT